MPFLVVALVIIAVVVVVLIVRARRADDGVEGFRRQIDALSSDARRPTIDRRFGDDDGNDDQAENVSDDVSEEPTEGVSETGPPDDQGGPSHPIDPGLRRTEEDEPDGP